MNKKLLEWALRIGIAGEFFGHGMLAIGGKADWISWFAKFGINNPVLAKQLLLYVGIIDVTAAFIMFLIPFPAILLGAAIWAFWTALLRPIVGVGWLDFVERSANWGAPLALLAYYGWPRNTASEWFSAGKKPNEVNQVNQVN